MYMRTSLVCARVSLCGEPERKQLAALATMTCEVQILLLAGQFGGIVSQSLRRLDAASELGYI